VLLHNRGVVGGLVDKVVGSCLGEVYRDLILAEWGIWRESCVAKVVERDSLTSLVVEE
jgi:hypothetical protein